MNSHGKLLSFLVAWLTTVAVAFFLTNVNVFGDTCLECGFCEMLTYAAFYDQDEDIVTELGYINDQGEGWARAFLGGACQDPANNQNIFRDGSTIGENCGTTATNGVLTAYSYTLPNWTCDLPAGATPSVRQFDGGLKGNSLGTTYQLNCWQSGS